MVILKRTITFYAVLGLVIQVFAQGPNNTGTYYKNADGKSGRELKTAMAGIINTHTQLSYDDLWEAFMVTDKRSDGKVWDMYSGITDYEFVTSGCKRE